MKENLTLEQLLAIRDGDVSKLQDDIVNGDDCQRQLKALDSVAGAFFLEAEMPPPSNAYAKIQAAIEDKQRLQKAQEQQTLQMMAASQTSGKSPRWQSISSAIYTLAFAVAFTGLVSLYSSHRENEFAVQSNLALQANIQALKDNSRGLEYVLQSVGARNDILSNTDRLEADRLYWRLMMVDQKIQEGNRNENPNEEQISLWRDRVDTLTQLNQLYYTNQSLLDNSEL